MASDYEVKQAIGIVARLGGFSIKRVATTDDLKERVLTVTLTRVSDGWVQESMSFEDIPPMVAHVDGNGHVDSIDGVQPGDLAETGEQADKEINDHAAAALEAELADREPVEQLQDGAEEGIPERTELGEEPPPVVHLVGEAAAVAKKRR